MARSTSSIEKETKKLQKKAERAEKLFKDMENDPLNILLDPERFRDLAIIGINDNTMGKAIRTLMSADFISRAVAKKPLAETVRILQDEEAGMPFAKERLNMIIDSTGGVAGGLLGTSAGLFDKLTSFMGKGLETLNKDGKHAFLTQVSEFLENSIGPDAGQNLKDKLLQQVDRLKFEIDKKDQKIVDEVMERETEEEKDTSEQAKEKRTAARRKERKETKSLREKNIAGATEDIQELLGGRDPLTMAEKEWDKLFKSDDLDTLYDKTHLEAAKGRVIKEAKEAAKANAVKEERETAPKADKRLQELSEKLGVDVEKIVGDIGAAIEASRNMSQEEGNRVIEEATRQRVEEKKVEEAKNPSQKI